MPPEIKNTIKNNKKETPARKVEIGWHNANPATGMTPNMWVEQDPRDKAKNLLKRL